jgi:nitrile hydratase accessory protein
LSRHEVTPSAGELSVPPRLPPDAGGPVFAEPWQAAAFALAQRLCSLGHFTPGEWATALAAELRLAAEVGAADDSSGYYHGWVAALERLVIAKGLCERSTLQARKDAWADAFRHTPHGEPVELRDGVA